MAGNIRLDQEQEELLATLVEACRNVPRKGRQPFQVMTTDESHFAHIRHSGLPSGSIEAYPADIKVLARKGLLAVSYDERGISEFDLNPEGFDYYSQMKLRDGQPLQRVEAGTVKYLDADGFQQKYSSAYKKWKEAESLLWGSDSERQLTTIGHLCREAVQEFAATLVQLFQPPNIEPDKAKTVARLRAVLKVRENQFGDKEQAFLNALVVYWGTVSDLIQRQEHGGQKDRALVWEDGRRVVFQTAILMSEVDSSLSKNS
jgi:hypothetical protein